MKLFEFEEIKKIDTPQFNEMLQHCEKSHSSTVKLYRGIDQGVSIHTTEFLGTIRKDRRLKDSSLSEASIFNKIMKHMNWPITKHNSLSTAINYYQTLHYGTFVYKIYPFDDATYLYSTKHTDMIYIPDIFVRLLIGKKLIPSNLDVESINSTFKYINEYFDELFPQVKTQFVINSGLVYTDDINLVQNAKGEVLVYGTNYLAEKSK